MKERMPCFREYIVGPFVVLLVKGTHVILLACLGVLVLTAGAWAGRVTVSDAQVVATNWISLIIHYRGDWGGSPTAQVQEVQEFKRGNRMLGYLCKVSPEGYVIVSLVRGLSPVTDFSWEGELDPDVDEGLTDLIKDGLERTLNAVEKEVGPIDKAKAEDLRRVVGTSDENTWLLLASEPGYFKANLDYTQPLTNYQAGEELLTSRWHQFSPFNIFCPTPPAGSTCELNNCTVGCVGLSACEIMRHWAWPPRGTVPPYDHPAYNWAQMPDTANDSSPLSQKIALAELCYEVGVAIQSDYCIEGGCATSSNFTNVKHGIENYFYYANTSVELFRKNYPPDGVTWFNMIKQELNLNRPVQYSYPGHAIVADGWMEIYPGPQRWLHLCYGFPGGGNTDWHKLEEIPGGGPTTDSMLVHIYPAPALGSSISGVYAVPSFPYRYFDRDCSATYAVFRAGHQLQFLHNITVQGSSYSSESRITFYGSPSLNTRLFSRGDPSKGIRTYNGAVQLRTNGGIKFY